MKKRKQKDLKKFIGKFTGKTSVTNGPVSLGEHYDRPVFQDLSPAELIGTGLVQGQVPPHLYPLFVGVYMEG